MKETFYLKGGYKKADVHRSSCCSAFLLPLSEHPFGAWLDSGSPWLQSVPLSPSPRLLTCTCGLPVDVAALSAVVLKFTVR